MKRRLCFGQGQRQPFLGSAPRWGRELARGRQQRLQRKACSKIWCPRPHFSGRVDTSKQTPCSWYSFFSEIYGIASVLFSSNGRKPAARCSWRCTCCSVVRSPGLRGEVITFPMNKASVLFTGHKERALLVQLLVSFVLAALGASSCIADSAAGVVCWVENERGRAPSQEKRRFGTCKQPKRPFSGKPGRSWRAG